MGVTNIFVLFVLLVGLVSADNHHVFSVTSFPEIEEFYLRARKYDVNKHHPVLEKPMWKTNGAQNSRQRAGNFCLCKSILSSTHFKHRGIYPLNWEDPDVKIEMSLFHEALFEKFYPPQSGAKNESKKPSPPSERDSPEKYERRKKEIYQDCEKPPKMEIREAAVDDNQLVYTLPYAEYPVDLSDQFLSEKVVFCLARSTVKPFGIKPYYVSLAYRPHRDATDEQRMYFVFRTFGRSLVLEALAEEVAVARRRLTNVEKNYLMKKWLYDAKPTKKRWDPICSLSASIKLRICASIVASQKYRQELEFVPALANVFGTCHMRDVFLYELSRRGGNLYGSEGLSEWMYTCWARKIGSALRTVRLLVSRSYDDRNSVFVYKVINGRYEMVDYFENIYPLYRQ